MSYQKLFNHLYDEHGLILFESEMQEIIRIVSEIISELKDEVRSVSENEDQEIGCPTCKFVELHGDLEPCCTCMWSDYSKWQPT